MNQRAPIAIFIYRRPDHTRKMLEALGRCPEFELSPVFVFADGPRSSEDYDSVNATRRVAREMLGVRAVFEEAKCNRGLADSIVHGVTQLCGQFGRVIVLEDDILVAPEFLSYMNAALDRYAEVDEVMQISAHMYLVEALSKEEEVQFLPVFSSWGWGVWQRSWSLYDSSGDWWRENVVSVGARRRFDLEGHYPYVRMMSKQLNGQLDSWAIRWYATMFRYDGLTAFPPRTLVANIGLDGSGTHSHYPLFRRQQAVKGGYFPVLPSQVEVSRYKRDVYRSMQRFVWTARINKGLARVRLRMSMGIRGGV